MKLLSKVSYFINSTLNYFKPSICSFCGSKDLKIIDNKYLVTRLLECSVCKLRQRHPSDTDGARIEFYNSTYKQDGITTDLPSPNELQDLLTSKFKGTSRNIDSIANILRGLKGSLTGQSILDYGCSWGYMTWQFKDLGMYARGFEIGKKRADFGAKYLGVDIVTNENDVKGKFDFVFSSHVIEHLNDIRAYVALSLKHLNDQGFLVILCPNGSDDLRKMNFDVFHNLWGQVHPNIVSASFYKGIFNQYPYYISSSPYKLDEIATWDQKQQVVKLNGGDELLCIVKKIKL